VGLHADPRRAEERGAPRGAIDDSAHPESGRSSTRAAAADLMANVSQGALGCHRRRRLFHDRSLDVAGLATYYTVFVLDLASRRVHVLGSMPHPSDVFMGQIVS
jgi:hypothetical protein